MSVMEETVFLTSHIKDLDLTGERILLRLDLNVPVVGNKIINDHKIKQALPTIDMLQKKGAKVIIMTHIGRPKEYPPGFSTKHLIPWFKQNGYVAQFEPNFDKAKMESYKNPNDILLLENLRFFDGEQNEGHFTIFAQDIAIIGDKQDVKAHLFAKNLADIGDYYVNDAFGAMHRHDTSITLVPQLFDPKKRFLGPLVERESLMLSKLVKNPEQPFTLIMGGGKIKDKLPLLAKLVDKVDTILLCPAIVFTFSKFLGKKIGKSLVDDSVISIVPDILKKAQEKGVNILFPLDYQAATDNFNGPLSYTESEAIEHNHVGVSIGPKTEGYFKDEILKSKTIFFNGAFGNMNKNKTLEGMKHILEAMGEINGFSVVGGGDSVAVANMFGIANKIDYLSTGGGATLTYVSGLELPGLKAFEKEST